MKALLIEFNKNTGKRAGNVSPRDKNLFCFGHQNLESEPAREIRIIRDNRDLTKYKNMEGVTLLNNNKEIDDAIDEFIEINKPEQFVIVSDVIFKLHVEQRGIILDDIPGNTVGEILSELKKQGIKGLRSTKKKIVKTKDIRL